MCLRACIALVRHMFVCLFVFHEFHVSTRAQKPFDFSLPSQHRATDLATQYYMYSIYERDVRVCT